MNGPISASSLNHDSVVHGSVSLTSITVNGTITRDATGNVDRQAIFVGPDTVAIPGVTIGTFTNNGSLLSLGSFGTGLSVWGNINTFVNNGRIQGSDAVGVYILGDAPSFTNNVNGVITGGLFGAVIVGANGSGTQINVANHGLISGTGDLSSTDPSLRQGGGINLRADSTVVNTGTISSQFAGGLVMGNGTVTNSGLITGVVGILERTDLSTTTNASGVGLDLDAIAHTAVNITNSGQIVGTGGVAIDLGGGQGGPGDNPDGNPVSADTLTLLNGSSISGLVDFGAGTDLLDISQFTGSMVLDTRNLENLKLDGGAPVDFSTFNSAEENGKLIARSNGTIAVIDAPSVDGGSGATATQVADVTGQIASVVSGQLDSTTIGGGETGEPASAILDYASPAARGAAANAASGEADTSAPANKFWISGFGGGSRDLTGPSLSSLFGGIVAGSHAQLDANNQLGLMGGYVRSNLDVGNGQQTIDSSTIVLGGYGRSQLDPVTVDFSVLGGYGFNHSSRDTGGGGIAVADFSSWFLAPQVGLTIPVLSSDGRSVNFGLQGKYIFGSVSGYTESGSLANLTLSATPISLIDVRAELSGSTPVGNDPNGVKLTAKAGVFVQSNLGTSTVQISVLGQTFATATPNTLLYGPYASVGLDAPLSSSTDLTATLNASGRNDGMVTASGKLQLTAAF